MEVYEYPLEAYGVNTHYGMVGMTYRLGHLSTCLRPSRHHARAVDREFNYKFGSDLGAGENFFSKNDFFVTSHLSRAASLPGAELLAETDFF